jgi:hypothetical protein
MSYISDFKAAPFSLFGINGGVTSSEQSNSTIVGVEFNTSDGRKVVIVQNGAVALVAGVLVQSPATIGANHTGLTLSTAAIGATTITATLGATAVTANQYAGGLLVVSAGTGIGQTLRIASHPAAALSTAVVLTLEDPLSVATLTSDSKGSLTLPQFGSKNGVAFTTSGVIINPTTATGRVIGVTISPIPASTATTLSYGFIQTKGAVAVLNDTGTAIGLDVMPSSSVAGAVTKAQLITLQL